MRLRISVRRHELPPTNILFTTLSLGPSSTASGTNATVAHLLEDINDIVPLESGCWGLEDYAVEVNGYECLHFQPIESVLREDDQVVIRALRTDDLKMRRLGGRHQISADGRHLIDGVAFGKQWLRKGSRPPVLIPSRKRRRLEIEGEARRDQKAEAGQLVLAGRDPSRARGEINDDGEGADTDFVVDNEAPLQITASQYFEDADADADGSSEDDDNGTDTDEVEVNLAEVAEELDGLLEDNPARRGTLECEANNKDDFNDIGIITRSRKRKRELEATNEAMDETDFDGFSSPVAPGIDDEQDSDTSSSGSSLSSSDSSEDDEVGYLGQIADKGHNLDGSADSDDSTSSSDLSSSSGSDSDSTSDDEFSSSSSESSEEASSNEVSPVNVKSRPEAGLSMEKLISLDSVLASSVPVKVPHGEGSKRTRDHNARQRKRKRLDFLKANGSLPSTANFHDLEEYEVAVNKSAPQAEVLHANIEAKKDDMIEEFLNGRLNPGPAVDGTRMLNGDPITQQRTSIVAGAMDNAKKSSQLSTPNELDTSANKREIASASPTTLEPAKPRARLDVASMQRMVFGSLGHRAPKTESARKALQEKLAMPVKKGASPKQLKALESSQKEDTVETRTDLNADEAWKRKLVVSAIECDVEGVTLKPPPFPFVQNWDEDVKHRFGKGAKKKARNQRKYYNYNENNEIEWNMEEAEADDGYEGVTLATADASGEPEREPMNGINGSSTSIASDLPLPDSFDNLEWLQKEDALPQSVIAFKELYVSTNCQPEISGYRVALINRIGEDESLEITLSRRDRVSQKTPHTGEEAGPSRRNLFEIMTDHNKGEDNGNRIISLDDLIDPKIVQRATQASLPAKIAPQAQGKHGAGQTDSAPESTIIPESVLSQNVDVTSAQPTEQVRAVTGSGDDLSSPHRAEISAIINEAGWDSHVDSELLRPISGASEPMTEKAQESGAIDKPRESRQDPSPESRANHPTLFANTSGLESPRFNSWSSSPQKEPQHMREQEDAEDSWLTTQNCDELSQEGKSSPNITYPHLSQLDLGEPVTDDPDMAHDRPGVGDGMESPSARATGVRSDFHGEDNLENDDARPMTGFDSPRSGQQSSLDSAADRRPGHSNPFDISSSPFLGGRNGHVSSDDDLPPQAKITSTRSRSAKVSPPPLKRAVQDHVSLHHKSISPFSGSDYEFNFTIKQSQSETPVQLSQIPPGTQVVDLTFSSSPVSPGGSDSEFRGTQPRKTRTRSGRTSKKGNAEEAKTPLLSNEGLGNRRFLRTKKVKA